MSGDRLGDPRELVKGYNEKFRTKHRTWRELLAVEYAKLELQELERRLGISKYTIYREQKRLGLLPRRVGGLREANGKRRREWLESHDVRGLTTAEIARELECSLEWTRELLKRLGLTHKKLPGGRTPAWQSTESSFGGLE